MSDRLNSAPKSMTAWTYEQLREGIVTARYKPDTKLRIDALCEELEVSSGAVREALSRLTADGFVVTLPQRGFFVAPISRADLIQLTEVRIHVECVCLELSIERGDYAWEGRVLSAFHQLSRLTKTLNDDLSHIPPEWPVLHEKFHDELAAACGNDWWLRLRRQLYIQSERYRRLSGPYAEGTRDVDGEHKAIMEAALNRDAKLAKKLLAAHLQTTTDILLRSKIKFTESAGEEAKRPVPSES